MLIKLTSLFFLLFASTSLSYGSESPVLANRLFKNHQYYEAITEYKRYLYFDRNSEIVDSIYLQIAISYRYLGDINSSNQYFALSIVHANSQKILSQISIEKAINHLLCGNLDMASHILTEVIESKCEIQVKRQALFYLSVLHVLNSEYEEAKFKYQYYLQLDSIGKISEEQERILCLFDSASMIKFKNPNKAKIFSSIFPGSGQIYCEAYFSGINAFLINSSLIVLVAISIYNTNYINAIVYAYFLRLFYSGNRFRSEIVCNNYNQSLDHAVQETILIELLKGIMNRNLLE